MGKRLSEAVLARCGRDGFLFPVDYGAAEREVHAQAMARFREANREETRRFGRAAP